MGIGLNKRDGVGRGAPRPEPVPLPSLNPICLHPQCQDHFPTSHGSYLPWNFHFGGAFLQSNIGSSEFLFANGNFLGNSNSHAMSHGAGWVSPTFHKFLGLTTCAFPKSCFYNFYLHSILKKYI